MTQRKMTTKSLVTVADVDETLARALRCDDGLDLSCQNERELLDREDGE